MDPVMGGDVPPFARAHGNPGTGGRSDTVGTSRQGLTSGDIGGLAERCAGSGAASGRLRTDWSASDTQGPETAWWRMRESDA